MSNKITILCSNYNSDKWIEGYLECLDKQTIPFDIVFVDANSTDNSLWTIQTFKFSNPEVNKTVITSDKRIGLYNAWNMAIQCADTEYVMNLNTDDRIFVNTLDMYDFFSGEYPDVDLFYSKFGIVEDIGHEEILQIRQWPAHAHNRLLQFCYGGPFPLVKKQTLIEMGLFNTRYFSSADYDMWLRMSYFEKKFRRIDMILGTFYLNKEGISNNPDKLEQIQSHDREIQAKYVK